MNLLLNIIIVFDAYIWSKIYPVGNFIKSYRKIKIERSIINPLPLPPQPHNIQTKLDQSSFLNLLFVTSRRPEDQLGSLTALLASGVTRSLSIKLTTICRNHLILLLPCSEMKKCKFALADLWSWESNYCPAT